MEESEELHPTCDGDLADERREDLLRDEVGGRSLGVDPREGFGSAHWNHPVSSVVWARERKGRTRDGDRENEEQIDVKELVESGVSTGIKSNEEGGTNLEISERTCDRVEQRDRRELNERVQRPVDESKVSIQRPPKLEETHMNLKQLKLVTSAARPSLMTSIKHRMSG